MTRWQTESPSAAAVGLLLIEMLFLKPLRKPWSFDVYECLSLKLIVSVDLINVFLKVFFLLLVHTQQHAERSSWDLCLINLHKSVSHEELYSLGSCFCFPNLIEFYVLLLICIVHFKHACCCFFCFVFFAVDLSLF